MPVATLGVLILGVHCSWMRFVGSLFKERVSSKLILGRVRYYGNITVILLVDNIIIMILYAQG